jgi:hypothetical protein
MGQPPLDVQARLAACQVSSETLAGEKHPKLFANTVMTAPSAIRAERVSPGGFRAPPALVEAVAP